MTIRRWLVAIFLYGALSWLLPFLVSLAFYGPNGKIVGDATLDSIMMIVVASVSAWLLAFVVRCLRPTTVQSLGLGTSWMLIDLVLDVIVLLPLIHLDLGDYLSGIGLRYLAIPVIAMAIGSVVPRRGVSDDVSGKAAASRGA